MKNLLILSALVLSAGVLLAQPKIEAVGGTSIEFGDVITGKKVETVLTIKNAGTEPLEITDVKAQCGCTAAMMKDHEKMVPPNGTTKVSIAFDTQSFGGSKVSKQVYISSNDSTNPKMTITFSANVINILDVDPKMISFENLKVDTTVTKTITISNPSPKNAIKITGINPKSENLKISLMKNELLPGEKTQLQATFTPSKAGTFNGSIEIQTNHAEHKTLELRYYAWVNRK